MFRTICLFLTLCAAHALHAQDIAPSDSTPVNVYRHYTGTIGTHKAVMDVRYGFPGAANYAGSSYYFTDEPGLNFFLIRGPEAYSRTKGMRAQVFPEHLPLSQVGDVYSELVQTIRFDFGFTHDSLSGAMYMPNTMEPLRVKLKEDRNSAFPFLFQRDSAAATATGKKGESLKATAIYYGVQPGAKMKKKDAEFITKAVARFMGGAEKEHSLPATCTQSYLDHFKTAAASGRKMDGNSFAAVFTLFPVYSDNGILVLQLSGYHYDFENAAYTDKSRYLCLDVQNEKVLQPDDLLVKGDQLRALLERTFRAKYQIEAGIKLSDLFITPTMPLTDNFFPVNKGIIFSYSPAAIFKEDLDIAGLQEMRLFLSYDELSGILKPEYRARMGIK